MTSNSHRPGDAQHPALGPSDGTTLTAILDSYRLSGYTSDFWAEPDAAIRCGSCANVIAATKLAMQSVRRLEGASDPADMVTVVATTCPICGADGTLVLSYGPMASAVDAAVSSAMSDLRQADDRLPPNAAPDEQGSVAPHPGGE